LEAETKLLRERFLALYFIASGLSASQTAQELGRTRQTVAEWVQRFNREGPEALTPKWRGHPGKRLTDEELEQLRAVVHRPPHEAGIPAERWTAKWVAIYVHRAFGKPIHPETARRYLHQLGIVRDTLRKRLIKTDRVQQQAVIQELHD
ncbi:MAG: helix-turn-helix domain-containing protein, partial [Anaerolineae bacterium]